MTPVETVARHDPNLLENLVWRPGVGRLAWRLRRLGPVRAAGATFGAVAASVLLAWLALSQPWMDSQSPGPAADRTTGVNDGALAADFAVSTGPGSMFSLSGIRKSLTVC